MKLIKSHRCFSGFTNFYEHASKQTKTTMKFSVYCPDNIKKANGGLIWLSGLTCNEENFITKAGAQRVLSEQNMLVICPDTSPRGLDLPGEHESYDFGSGAGFYVDATSPDYAKHYRMYSYINDEIYNLFNDTYNLKKRIGIFGHSMGGHGALTIGLKNSNKYKSISAFSPLVNPVVSAWGKKALTNYLGADEKTWRQYDACELLKLNYKHSNEILIDQGLADEFYPEQLLTENFEKLCKEKSQKTTVNYHADYDHSYYFISSFIEKHINHHAKYFL